MSRGRVGEERGGKEIDRCSLTVAGIGQNVQAQAVYMTRRSVSFRRPRSSTWTSSFHITRLRWIQSK
jgi:hypothetical protein